MKANKHRANPKRPQEAVGVKSKSEKTLCGRALFHRFVGNVQQSVDFLFGKRPENCSSFDGFNNDPADECDCEPKSTRNPETRITKSIADYLHTIHRLFMDYITGRHFGIKWSEAKW